MICCPSVHVCVSLQSLYITHCFVIKMEEYGWGAGSIVMMMVVVAVLFFLPLVMGPLQPPSASVLLIFLLVLVAIFIFLHQASK